MIAKRDDLIAQGMDAEIAIKKAKESLSAVDFLIDGNQLTNVGKYHLECIQTVLLNCIIFLDIFFASFIYRICFNQLYRAYTCYRFGLHLYCSEKSSSEQCCICLGDSK